jgi:hypothetical protein
MSITCDDTQLSRHHGGLTVIGELNIFQEGGQGWNVDWRSTAMSWSLVRIMIGRCQRSEIWLLSSVIPRTIQQSTGFLLATQVVIGREVLMFNIQMLHGPCFLAMDM